MKRKTVKSIACAAIMALALSATACGSKDAANTDDSAVVEDTADTQQEAEPEAEDVAEPEAEDVAEPETEDTADAVEDTTGSAEGYTTLEDYYNDPSVKSALDAAFESMGGEGMTLSVDVKENVLTMTCKFEDSSVVVDGIADALNEQLDAQAATFQQQAATFDEAIGQTGACTVVVRYTDPDDNVLCEKEFKAQ